MEGGFAFRAAGNGGLDIQQKGCVAMRRLSIAAALFAAAAMSVFSCGAAFADAEWDSFVAEMESRMKIKEEGESAYTRIALLAPQGSDAELFRLSTEAPSVETRAAAGAALVKKLFPDGDPANWEMVSGFIGGGSYVPRQIVAVNALYNAVTALSELSDGKYAAAWLMTRFGSTSRAKLIFIDSMPAQFRETLDRLIAETGMPGAWETTRIEGPWPFVPVFNGWVRREKAIAEGYQFLDGFGGVAPNGPYAWDRVHGYVYKVFDPSDVDYDVD